MIAALDHDLLGLLQHEDAAIDARVHPRAVPILRIEHYFRQVLVLDVDDLDGDAEIGAYLDAPLAVEFCAELLAQ